MESHGAGATHGCANSGGGRGQSVINLDVQLRALAGLRSNGCRIGSSWVGIDVDAVDVRACIEHISARWMGARRDGGEADARSPAAVARAIANFAK